MAGGKLALKWKTAGIFGEKVEGSGTSPIAGCSTGVIIS